MPIKKAHNHYLGQEGCPKLNCGQAVLAGFQAPEELISEFALYGSGRAPDGWCGAAFAAARLLEDKKTVEDFFTAQADSVKCLEIRSKRKLSCLGCVEKAAELIQKIKNFN